MIIETIITTVRADGKAHIAPLGIRTVEGKFLLAPFRPSTTLDNLERSGHAVVNLTDDVRVFAGCLSGRRDWPVHEAQKIPGFVLDQALTHIELKVDRVEQDDLRPRFFGREILRADHAPFAGFNRAQAAVIEASILVSRLHMLTAEKIDRELDYLKIAVEKTAGPKEQQAWDWLMQAIAEFRIKERSS